MPEFSEVKWLAIGVIGMFFAIAIMTFAPDDLAQRIAACMTQPEMQFVDGDCIPITTAPTE